ncbi:MAG: AraC family transcriptional regulator [Myxococcales bacterium]
MPSLDEASDLYSRMTAPVHIHGMPGKEPFFWRVHQLTLGPLALVASETRSSVWADCEGAADAYLLSLPLESNATAESTIGKAVTPLVSGRSGLLCAPWQSSKVVVRSGFRSLQVVLPRQAVHDGLRTLTGAESREVQFAARIALDSPPVEPLMRLITSVLREADQEHPEFTEPGADACWAEALIFRFLLCQPSNQSGLFKASSRSGEPRHVRRAAEYIDAHFGRSVTMAELTRVAGIGARSLQLGFQKHRGCSPLDFARARRLERARVLLLTSDTLETVSEVARITGVGHLGRFSIRYRKRFGESPSDTLARRWSRTGQQRA